MTDKPASRVVSLSGAPITPGEPVPEVVALLDKLLDDARSGRLRAIAVAGIARDGMIWTGSAQSDEIFRTHLLGVITLLLHETAAKALEP